MRSRPWTSPLSSAVGSFGARSNAGWKSSPRRAAHPEVPWRQVAGIGNILRHDYQRVEPRLIWNLLDEHLPVLEGEIRAILADMPDVAPGPDTPD